jgi:transcriptional antiterminator NusG
MIEKSINTRPRINRKEVEFLWYMVRVATNKEDKAIDNLKHALEVTTLDRFVGEIVCPREKKYFLRNNKKVERESVMFPGYILMNMNPIAEVSRLIKSTNFAIEIMSNSNGPEAITEAEVQRIFGHVEKSHSEIEFLIDESVTIVDGPFSGFDGVIKDVDKSKNRVQLQVLVFGQPNKVDLRYNQIDKLKTK